MHDRPQPMGRLSVGRKLYASIMAIFVLFAVAFIVFQQSREKQFKIDTLDMKLQAYNDRMEDNLRLLGRYDSAALSQYVSTHGLKGLRVTITDTRGNVLFDNKLPKGQKAGNHINRPEMRQALAHGKGASVDRKSKTINHDHCSSATYYPDRQIIIRSALPYDDDLAKSLSADQHYIWFALGIMLVLTIVLWRFTGRLSRNINNLRAFATKADHNESIDTEDLVAFPADELGEIAERIIKIYKRLESTRKEQDVLKRQLTQNIAHELKTPVASIQGYLETILGNPDMTEETRQLFMQRCFAQSQRLTALLHDISTLNRMDDAPEMNDFSEVDITQTMATIVAETALQMAEKGMSMDNRLPDNVRVMGNHSLIYSIFRNLTDNAIAYAGTKTTISVSAVQEGEMWHFRFSDNGVGVPREHLPRLFERFYRVDKGRSRKMGGTGLGLAIVKNAVLMHGGAISVENAPDGGLVFDFTLRK